jgi:hypothetical protein
MTNVFQSGGDFDQSGVSIGRCILPDSVPAGKRLVLETVTGFYYGDGAELGAAFLTVGSCRFAFPWVQCTAPDSDFSDRRFYGFNHFVRIYVDGPAQLEFDVDGATEGGDPTTGYSGTYAVAGYLVDL